MTMAAVTKPQAKRRKNLIVARSDRSRLNHRPKPGPPKISDALVPPKPNEFDST